MLCLKTGINSPVDRSEHRLPHGSAVPLAETASNAPMTDSCGFQWVKSFRPNPEAPLGTDDLLSFSFLPLGKH